MIGDHPQEQEGSLTTVVAGFLADLEQRHRSPHTRRAYAADLARFSAFYTGPASGITPEVLRAFFATRAHLAPATRARTQAVLASFFAWAYRREVIDSLPMARVERVRLDPPAPRGRRSSAFWSPSRRGSRAIACSFG